MAAQLETRRRVRASAQLTPLGKRIAEAIQRTGLTREQFAERAQVSRKTLYHVERGTLKRGVTASSVAQVEKVLKELGRA